MTGINPGNYYIINSQLSPFGNQLGINFIGERTPLVVSVQNQFLTQQWTVTGNAGSPQSISLVFYNYLQLGPAGNYIEALPDGAYTWNIVASPSGDGYVIQNDAGTQAIGINKASEGEQLILQQKTGAALQVWQFVPV